MFYVYQAPSVAFAQPTDGFTVENTPIAIQPQYDDPSGTLANATLTVSDGSRVVYTRNMGTETACEILATEWLPDNGGIARGKWNPADSRKMDQDVDYVQYIGREYPVAYMRDAIESASEANGRGVVTYDEPVDMAAYDGVFAMLGGPRA